ncbi:MAG: cytochrome c biogenesis protein CcsA [Deltaproteobacteria bacterium]|nr:cytochrome c biogenesis protein CcsA [Deltaproteobacteria bacterium]
MWSGFVAFFISSLLGLKWKNAKILAAGFAGNAICFFMMKFATGMLDSTIQPLVPVLRDNFWLSTHVTSITFSYGCFFLSWIVANALLIAFIFKNKKSHFVHSLNEWNRFLRVAIQIGAVFLAAGVLLGGIWADYSWGRFWGWDPKETWSLISLIVYVMILHGKYVGWFKDIVFTMITAFGFMFILMAWFGVNYILATGLHSYGFSSGGALFLAIIFLAQLSILGVACVLNLKTI